MIEKTLKAIKLKNSLTSSNTFSDVDLATQVNLYLALQSSIFHLTLRLEYETETLLKDEYE